MKKLLSLTLPIAVIFGLTGCALDTETVYLRKDFRKTVYYQDGSSVEMHGMPPKYEVRIDGNWYHADENGNLTDAGKKQKQIVEMQAFDYGGGC